MEDLRRWWADNKGEMYTIFGLSIPVSTGFLLNKLVSFVSVIFVGHLGPAELAAAALGSSLINVVGNSVLAGLAGAMSTLCGQVSKHCYTTLFVHRANTVCSCKALWSCLASHTHSMHCLQAASKAQSSTRVAVQLLCSD